MKLSVCYICKNEEKFIRDSISSIKDIAYEIIVVDTGSVDTSIKISKELGAKVIQHKWNNNFAEARNIGLDNATGDWILVLDCDETLSKESSLELKGIIDKNDERVEGLYLKVVNLIDESEASTAVVFRVFRNRKQYRFEGKIHEQIIQTIVREYGNKSVFGSEVIINHYGYDEKLKSREDKCNRNLEILLSYEDNDKNAYYYYSLANEYGRKGDNEIAIRLYKKALDLVDFKSDRFIFDSYLIINYIKVLKNCSMNKEIIDTVNKYKEYRSDLKDMYFTQGVSYLECGIYNKARESFEIYKSIEEQRYDYPDNKFHMIYNIENIINDITKVIGRGRYRNVTSVILVENKSGKLCDTIRKLNMFTDEVIVIDYNSYHPELAKAKLLFSKIVNINTGDGSKEIIKNSTKEWVLILKCGEEINKSFAEVFGRLLKHEDSSGLIVDILNQHDYSVKSEMRLLKKERFNGKEICTFEEVEKLILNDFKARKINAFITTDIVEG